MWRFANQTCGGQHVEQQVLASRRNRQTHGTVDPTTDDANRLQDPQLWSVGCSGGWENVPPRTVSRAHVLKLLYVIPELCK